MYSGGSGTALDPYLIATAVDLYDIRSNLGAYFKLVKDIDLLGTAYETFDKIGVGTSSPFTGEIDGNGKVIKNIIHNIIGDFNGFIAYANGATVKNLGFEDVNTEDPTNTTYAGVIIGDMRGGTIVEKCYATGKFKVGTSTSSFTGGLVGQSETSTDRVRDCWTDIDLRSYEIVGGIIGANGGGAATIERCYAVGNINADDSVGGISNSGIVQNSAAGMSSLTAFGAQTSFSRIGFGPVTNCYANSAMTIPRTPINDVDDRDGGNKTLTELKQRATYETGLGWDFDDVWMITEGQFPTLQVFASGINAIFFGTNF